MTKDLWLTLGRDAVLNAIGYCDADWASQPHRHSISGYAFYFGGGVVMELEETASDITVKH